MTVHRIGLDQTAWDALKQQIVDDKMPPTMDLGLTHGASTAPTVDTLDVPLDIRLEITHLDVAQGESTLILLTCEPEICRRLGVSPCLMSILIDGGLSNDGGGLIARTLRLANLRDLDAAIISHFDGDHTEGVTRIISEISLAEVATERRDDAEQALAKATTAQAAAQVKVDSFSPPPARKDPGFAAFSAARKALSSATTKMNSATRARDAAQAWLDRLLADLDDTADRPARPGTPGWKAVRTQNIFLRLAADELDDAALAKQTGVVQALTHAVGRSGANTFRVAVGDTLQLDCDADRGLFTMNCLAVNGGGTDGDDSENANSIAWLLTFGKYSYYTAGDLPSTLRGANIEDALDLGAAAPLTAMKCGHHGSHSSTSAAFLKAAQPRLAFVSSGKQDGFGHPHTQTLLRLWHAEGLEATFVTNCYYNRPFFSNNFLGTAMGFLRTAFGNALAEASRWPVPQLRPGETSARSSEENAADNMRRMRADWDKLTAAWQSLLTTLQTDGDDATSDELRKVQAAPQGLADWYTAHQAMSGMLRSQSGYRTSAGVHRANFGPDTETYKSVIGNLRWAADEATQVMAARESVDKPPAQPPAMYLGAAEGQLGNLTLVMHVSDANASDRTCWVGMPRWAEWAPFTYKADAIEPMPDETAQAPEMELFEIWQLDALRDIPVPGSPQHYPAYLDERDQRQRKRKGDFGGGDEPPPKRKKKTPVSTGPTTTT